MDINILRGLYFRQIQGRILRIAEEMTRSSSLSSVAKRAWHPPINVYRCREHFLVVADIAGVDGTQIQLSAEPRRLALQGRRISPEITKQDSFVSQVLVMEIEYGLFERSILLPEEIDPRRMRYEHQDGLLWIILPKADAAKLRRPI